MISNQVHYKVSDMWRKYVAKRHTVHKATIRKHWHTLNRNAFFVHSTNTIWWVIQYVLCVLSLKEYNIRIIVQFAFQWNCLLCTSSVSSWQSDVFPKLFITWCKLRRAQHKTLSEIMEMKNPTYNGKFIAKLSGFIIPETTKSLASIDQNTQHEPCVITQMMCRVGTA